MSNLKCKGMMIPTPVWGANAICGSGGYKLHSAATGSPQGKMVPYR